MCVYNARIVSEYFETLQKHMEHSWKKSALITLPEKDFLKTKNY